MDWSQFYLFQLIFMRMTGFVLFNPLFGRNNLTNYFRAALVMVLSIFVFTTTSGVEVQVPSNVVGFMTHLLLELWSGFVLAFIMQMFFSVVYFGGGIMDAQMGMTMAQVYDASSQINMTVTASVLNVMMVLNFFAENGHYTLMRILLTSGQVLPYGATTLAPDIATYVADIFVSCMVLAVKLAFPILAAELLGQLGMGILMKAIPQINAFVINIELQVILGFAMLLLCLIPMNEFLLQLEMQMLTQMGQVLQTIGSLS